jgi:hypothetical protein
MATRRSPLLLAGAGAVVVTALVVGALWLGNRGHTASSSVPQGSPARNSAPRGQAGQVAAALRKLSSDPQLLVASGAQSQVHGRARRAVPPGSMVVPDARSWAPDGLGGGTMLVTITAPGRAPNSYYAVMVREASQWKVLATIRLPAPVPAPSGSPS